MYHSQSLAGLWILRTVSLSSRGPLSHTAPNTRANPPSPIISPTLKLSPAQETQEPALRLGRLAPEAVRST